MEPDEQFGLYRYRWVVLLSFMVVGALTQLMWLNYASIMTQTENIMGASEFEVTALMLMFPLLYIPVSIPAGIIIDRKGFRYAVALGAWLTAGFSFLRLFTTSYPLVLIGMIGIAVGQPFVLNSITKMVAAWFPTDESALATGVGTLSLFIGMILATALSPALLSAFGGETPSAMRWLILVYSLAALGGAVLFMLLAKPQPPKPPKRTEHELQAEDTAINWSSVKTIFSLHNFRLLLVILFIGNGAFVGILQLIEKIMRPKIWIAERTAATYHTLVTRYGADDALNHLKGAKLTAFNKHVSDTAGFIAAAMIVAGVVGCVVLPALSDKYMKRKPFILLAAAVAMPTLLLIGLLNLIPAMYAIAVVTGFFLFSAYPLVLTFAEETTGHALAGTATAILLLFGNAGGVVITILMEAVKSGTGGVMGTFQWAMVMLVVLFAVAFVVAWFLKENGAPKGEDSVPMPDV